MRITVSGHHLDLTDSIREATEQKLEKIASHYPSIEDCSVILTVDKNEHTAEISTRFSGSPIAVEARRDDLYAAITEAVKKLDAVLNHKKGAAKAQRHTAIS